MVSRKTVAKLALFVIMALSLGACAQWNAFRAKHPLLGDGAVGAAAGAACGNPAAGAAGAMAATATKPSADKGAVLPGMAAPTPTPLPTARKFVRHEEQTAK